MQRVGAPTLQTPARHVVAITPDWADPLSWLPVLSAHIAWTPLDADACLVLDARGAGDSAPAVREVVALACDYLAEEEDFAEVLLLEDEVDLERTGVIMVEDARGLIEALGLRPRVLRGSAALVVAHARWAKAVHDLARDRMARDRFERTPAPDASGKPLVTVRIPTYGAAELLIERALPSALNGSYRNLEVLVASDGPQPHARAAVGAVRDKRVRYLELPERPAYASGARAFWQTAGIHAINSALDAARGDFIAPLDHDDAFTHEHVAHLLEGFERTSADFVFGAGMAERADRTWMKIGSMPLRHGHVLHGAVMYSKRLAHLRYDADCWLLSEPGDWNLWRRIAQIGARVVHLAEPIIMHFSEASSMKGRDRRERPDEVAEDVMATGARRLLEIVSSRHGAWIAGESAIESTAPRAASAPDASRRLAMLDTMFPWRGSGFRFNEAVEVLRRRPDTVFFSQHRTPEQFNRAVHPLSDFNHLAAEFGITDVHAVFVNFVVGLLGLDGDPRARTVGEVVRGVSILSTLRENHIRFHGTLYPGGGLVPDTAPTLLREIAARSATVFSNTAEILDAVPEAVRVPVPMETEFYAFRDRQPGDILRLVFAADRKPRKGLDTALAALALLGPSVHLDIVGPHEREDAMPPDRTTLHGWLPPDQLRDVYWDADVFISPVRAEAAGLPDEGGVVDGFPTTAASEALASGLALISSNPRGEDWLLRSGEHYLEVPVADPQALAAAITHLAEVPAERQRLARAGAERLREVGDVRAVVAAKLAAMGLDGS
jgi:glycosyltransferase involved in cell wall biosynthesis